MAKFHIENLRLRTILGISDTERKDRQDIIINIYMWADTSTAKQTDSIDDCLNYRTICKKVIALIDESSFYTLEKLVGEVLVKVTEDSRVSRARVKIEKPHALRFADSISVEEEFRRDESA